MIASAVRFKERHPERVRELARRGSKLYRERWPDRCAKSFKKYQSSPKGKRKMADGSRRRKYGITPQVYDVMVLVAAGYCQLCQRQSESSRDKELVVDHCHKTNKIRGLICQACNKILGFMETHGFEIGWAGRAKQYLGET